MFVPSFRLLICWPLSLAVGCVCIVSSSIVKYLSLLPLATGDKIQEGISRGEIFVSFYNLVTLTWGSSRLGFYCNDTTIDAIPLSFLTVFYGKGGKPVINFSNVWFIAQIPGSSWPSFSIDMWSRAWDISGHKPSQLFLYGRGYSKMPGKRENRNY